MRKIYVSDITLCEAEESRRALTFREKLNIVASMAKAGLSAVELPALSGGAENGVIVGTIAQSAENIAVAINAGVTPEQIEATFEAVKAAKVLTLQIVLPISTVQMEYMYHLKSAKMLDKIAALVAEAKKYTNSVEFVALDATRAVEGFAEECAKVAAESGATAITLCDTAGVYFPEEMAELVKRVKAAAGIAVYVQPSNEMCMAAAITVSAIKAGADGVKTAAGNTAYLSAADFANIIRAKADALCATADLDITAIGNTIKSVAEVARAAENNITDAAAFSAEATLSDITAEIAALGYELSAEDNGKVYEEFCRVAAKKQSLSVAELEAIIASTAMQVPSTYHIVNYVVNSGNIINATANITLEKAGEQLSGVSIGDGPIDAAFHAIEQILGHHYELDDFQIQAVTKGREAVGSALIRLRAGGKLYSGNGVSTDIIGACIRAYINALNKIVYEEK